MHGSICGSGLSVTRPEHVGGVVALVERDDGVGVLVRHHREDQHREREDEVAELGFQGAVRRSGRRKVKHPPESSQSGVPLDLAGSPPYVSRLCAGVPRRGRSAAHQPRSSCRESSPPRSACARPRPMRRSTARSEASCARPSRRCATAAGDRGSGGVRRSRKAHRPRRPEAPDPPERRRAPEEPARQAGQGGPPPSSAAAPCSARHAPRAPSVMRGPFSHPACSARPPRASDPRQLRAAALAVPLRRPVERAALPALERLGHAGRRRLARRRRLRGAGPRRSCRGCCHAWSRRARASAPLPPRT